MAKRRPTKTTRVVAMAGSRRRNSAPAADPRSGTLPRALAEILESVNLTLVVWPVLAAECFLVDFPGRGLWQVGHDLDLFRGLVRSFLLAYGFFDLIQVDLFAWADGDECGDGLA